MPDLSSKLLVDFGPYRFFAWERALTRQGSSKIRQSTLAEHAKGDLMRIYLFEE